MISVVVPAYNEAGAVGETIAAIRRALARVEHEVIVVDDGSTDDTGGVALAGGAKVIRQPHNLGYGAALKAGIRVAAFDTIVITDADGTYPADMIPTLIGEYQKGFSMVVGARTGVHESFVKAPLRRLLKWLVEFTTGRRIPDVNSGLRVFSGREITPYFDSLCDTFSFTTSVTLAYMMTAKFVRYVPIAYNSRVGETKVRLVRDSLRTLQYIVQAILYYNPLKLFLLICAGLAVVGVVSFIVAWRGSGPAYYAGVSSLLLIVPTFCLGLVADLLKQILARR